MFSKTKSTIKGSWTGKYPWHSTCSMDSRRQFSHQCLPCRVQDNKEEWRIFPILTVPLLLPCNLSGSTREVCLLGAAKCPLWFLSTSQLFWILTLPQVQSIYWGWLCLAGKASSSSISSSVHPLHEEQSLLIHSLCVDSFFRGYYCFVLATSWQHLLIAACLLTLSINKCQGWILHVSAEWSTIQKTCFRHVDMSELSAGIPMCSFSLSGADLCVPGAFSAAQGCVFLTYVLL